MVVFKKKQQGTKIEENPKIPASAFINSAQAEAAKRAGLTLDNSSFAVTAPQKSTTNLTMEQPKNTIYKGVDISKSFGRKDFATKEDYEQAKRQSQSYNQSSAGIAKSQMLQSKQEGEVAAIIQQQRMASLDPNLINQAGQLGTTPMPNITENSNQLDIGQALKEGLIQGGTGAAAGAATGATGGAVAGLFGGPLAPATSTAGAIAGGAVLGAIGGVGGFIRGVVTSLNKQTNENIGSLYVDLPTTTKNLRMLAADTNQGGNAAQNMISFNAQLEAMDESYAKLHLINQNKPLGEDATVQLARFENFYMTGGAREQLIREMQQAVYNPNPQKALLTAQDYLYE